MQRVPIAGRVSVRSGRAAATRTATSGAKSRWTPPVCRLPLAGWCQFLVCVACCSLAQGQERKLAQPARITPARTIHQTTPEEAKLAQERSQRLAELDKAWRSVARAQLADAHQKAVAAQAAHRQKTARELTETVNHLHATASAQYLGPQAIVMDRKTIESALQPVVVAPAPTPVARITDVSGLVATASGSEWKQGELQEGSLVCIRGEHFGAPPTPPAAAPSTGGNVAVPLLTYNVELQYGDAPKEFQQAPPLNHTLQLAPYPDSWNKCWSDTEIIAAVPILPPGELQFVGNLVVRRRTMLGENLHLEQSVKIDRAGPGINAMYALPEYNELSSRFGCASSGGTLTVCGSGFGDVAGKIFLKLTDPIGNLTQINLVAKNWSQQKVEADIPQVPGNYPIQTVQVYVINTQLNREAFSPIKFGPRMIVTQISGQDFLDLAHPAKQAQNDKAEQEGGLLLVTHDPECGPIIGSGNNGNDRFFASKPLPPNCELIKVTFAPVNPDDTNSAEGWALGKFANIMASIADQNYKELVQNLVDWFAVGFGAGSYQAEIHGPISATQPTTTVHWENACWGEHNGTPIKYFISFALRGPEGVVPNSP